MILLILAAVSGTGKSTVGRLLMSRSPRLKLSVSHTTRSPRSGEKNGVDYHFVSPAEFSKIVDDGGFAEWAEYVGNSYGTAKSTIEEARTRNIDLFFDIEIQGAAQLKAAYPDARTCFLLPPSWSSLEERLLGRGTDSHDVIKQRLERGRVELAAARDFDFLIVNDVLEDAVDELAGIYSGLRHENPKCREHLESLIASTDL